MFNNGWEGCIGKIEIINLSIMKENGNVVTGLHIEWKIKR
jgi:hypothetical protein